MLVADSVFINLIIKFTIFKLKSPFSYNIHVICLYDVNIKYVSGSALYINKTSTIKSIRRKKQTICNIA